MEELLAIIGPRLLSLHECWLLLGIDPRLISRACNEGELHKQVRLTTGETGYRVGDLIRWAAKHGVPLSPVDAARASKIIAARKPWPRWPGPLPDDFPTTMPAELRRW